MSMRTITLTGRPPVRIEEDNWPVIAKASDLTHDGQVRCQANRVSEFAIRVRQHEDGRCLVYATYNYSSNFQGARDLGYKAGVLLAASTDTVAICMAVAEVAMQMATGEHNGSDSDQWRRLAAECVADLPAEELDDTKAD